MTHPFLRWPLLALALACVSSPSHGLQLIDARDGVTVEAVISIKEATRIRIEHGPITDVFGNIHSSNCATAAPASTGAAAIPAMAPAVNPAGEIMLECDRDKGEVYVRPVGNATKPVNLFISSAGATYTLLLRRSDTPSDTIVIRDRNTARTGSALPHQGPLGTSANHVRAMKALLVAMVSERSATDVRMEEVNRPVQLWNEANFTLVRLFEARGLVGEKYMLTNISGQTMVLAEQEFDRADGSVLGVAIDNLNLRPGESTGVYVIRLGR
ncbi:MAG TPA: conjugal transfer pilus assembly protein TraK [Oxalobacteraceae bacterium]|nr:conjugal transfer pilus assembly protein TraK [Oxalobacteraceae bacterium]